MFKTLLYFIIFFVIDIRTWAQTGPENPIPLLIKKQWHVDRREGRYPVSKGETFYLFFDSILVNSKNLIIKYMSQDSSYVNWSYDLIQVPKIKIIVNRNDWREYRYLQSGSGNKKLNFERIYNRPDPRRTDEKLILSYE